MNPIRFWFGIFAILGVVMVIPGWVHFVGPGLTNTPIVTDWLVALTLPFMLLLLLASWVQSWS